MTTQKNIKKSYIQNIDSSSRLNRRLVEEIINNPSKCTHSTAPIGAVCYKSGCENRWCFKARPPNLYQSKG